MNVRHGMYRSPEYASWRKAKERCRNRDHHAWARYGGRGISTVYRRIRRGMDPVQAVQHPGRRRAA